MASELRQAGSCGGQGLTIAGTPLGAGLCPEPIDVVYTWVNGSDPVWQADMLKWRELEGLGAPVIDSNDTGIDPGTANRYRDSGELRYSLRSLFKYAPWVRRVFLVTNGQVPSWADLSHPRLTVIPHTTIFPNASLLPVFSSPAIEVNLHRIPGLSPRFIYFNDDVMLGASVLPDDFYSPSAGQRVFLDWPVPKCAPGCIDSWLGDGFCDSACNSTACSFDGGDCANGTVRWRNAAQSALGTNTPCTPGCPSSWVADRMCDARCNVPSCGYDAGDCGMTSVYADITGAEAEVALHSSQAPTSTPAWNALKEVVAGGPGGFRVEVDVQVIPDAPASLVDTQPVCWQLGSVCSTEKECRLGGWRAVPRTGPAAVLHGRQRHASLSFTVGGERGALSGGPFLVSGLDATLPADPAVYLNVSSVGAAAHTYGVLAAAGAVAAQRAWADASAGPSCLQRTLAVRDACQAAGLEGGTPSPAALGEMQEWVSACTNLTAALTVPEDDARHLAGAVVPTLTTADRGPGSFLRRGVALSIFNAVVVVLDDKELPSPLSALSTRLRMSERAIVEAARGDADVHPALAALTEPVTLVSLPLWLRYEVQYTGPSALPSTAGECAGGALRGALQCDGVLADAGVAQTLEVPLRLHLTGTLPPQGAKEEATEEPADTDPYSAEELPPGSRRRQLSGGGGRHSLPVVQVLPMLGAAKMPATPAAAAYRATAGSSPNWPRLAAAAWRDVAAAAAAPAPPASPHGRGLGDAYAQSLVFSNRLVNAAFGTQIRRVPAHMPHMVSVQVMAAMLDAFPQAAADTQRHRFRSGQDLQYAFTYFNFLMEGGGRAGVDMEAYWRRELDVDGSGALEWNELRTLAAVATGEAPTTAGMHELLGCLFPGFHLPAAFSASDLSVPLPRASFQSLMACPSVVEGLRKRVKLPPATTKGEKHQVGFRMIGDDFNATLGALDTLRATKPKFICVNDDMATAPPDTVRAVQDFYRSLVPLPCPMELPEGASNPEPLYLGAQPSAAPAQLAQLPWRGIGILLLSAVLVWLITRLVGSGPGTAPAPQHDHSS